MSRKSVLFAGHDFKFLDGFISFVRSQGWNVSVDRWFRHSRHNWFHSMYQLRRADVIFCEWGLGNAVWYARNKRPGQLLFVRVHAQEVRGDYLAKVPKNKVDIFIFVAEHIRRAALSKGMVDEHNSLVIPNAVDTNALALPKSPNAKKTVAMVGFAPKAKRLDRALDLITALRERDPDFRLVLKGKKPEELKWLMLRPEEVDFFERQGLRMRKEHLLDSKAVEFSRFSSDMPNFYKGVGNIVSLSDYESFHLGLAEGAASGATPTIFRWQGSDDLYPADWICDSVEEMVERIVHSPECPNQDAIEWVLGNYDVGVVYEQLMNLLDRVI